MNLIPLSISIKPRKPRVCFFLFGYRPTPSRILRDEHVEAGSECLPSWQHRTPYSKNQVAGQESAALATGRAVKSKQSSLAEQPQNSRKADGRQHRIFSWKLHAKARPESCRKCLLEYRRSHFPHQIGTQRYGQLSTRRHQGSRATKTTTYSRVLQPTVNTDMSASTPHEVIFLFFFGRNHQLRYHRVELTVLSGLDRNQ